MQRARCTWIVACIVALAAAVTPPAHAITNVYALQETVAAPGGTLLQYAVGAGGALAALAPAAIGGPARDIAVTPDGRFAYVTTSVEPAGGAPSSTILTFARGASGRMQQTGATAPMAQATRGLIVNPQGTRVYYGHPSNLVSYRAINADGSLDPESSFPLGNVSPLFAGHAEYLAMTPDGRNLYAAQYDGRAIDPIVWQSTIDPATGAGAPKTPAFVSLPAGSGASAVGRMAVTPSGSHLYLATNTPGAGIGRWAIDPATGALTGGTLEAPPADGYAEPAVALSAGGDALWAPSASAPPLAAQPERMRQFSVAAGGALAPLAPPTVNYVQAGLAGDLIAGPDGASLYLGQPGTVGEWSVGAGGALAHRANVPATTDPATINMGVALSPSQAPVAAFTAVPAAVGKATVFDGRASADPDGTIARYSWDFGDGASAPNGGPVVGHVYAAPGPRTVTLTVTDADGTSTAQLWTGARMLRNGGASARTARTVTVAAAAVPRPRKGKSVTLAAVRGKIRVRVPGSRRYVPIEQLTEVPLGSIVDARKGRARITAEVDARTGRTQSSIFWDWYFKVLQTKGSKPVTEARLVKGSFVACPRTRSARSARSALAAQAAATRKRSRKKVRRLWGSGKGDFRTGGKRSSATVRGTQWLVEDRCDGTLTRVKQGRVDVRDFRRKKIVRLRAGRRSLYLAKAP